LTFCQWKSSEGNDSGGLECAGNERGLGHGVNLRAIESCNKDREFIGGDVEAELVGADQRLISKARTAWVECSLGVGQLIVSHVKFIEEIITGWI